MLQKDEQLPSGTWLVIALLVCLLFAGFLGAATNSLFFDLLKEYQGLLGGMGAITAALIAYQGAMAKVSLDRRHREMDEGRITLARHLHVIRASRYNMTRLLILIKLLYRDESLLLVDARLSWKGHRPGPSGGLIECLSYGAELDPRVLVQLHRLYSILEYCNRITTDYDERGEDEEELRNGIGWIHPDIYALDGRLRAAVDVCRVLITLCREKIGSEYTLLDEEFNEVRDQTKLETPLPPAMELLPDQVAGR